MAHSLGLFCNAFNKHEIKYRKNGKSHYSLFEKDFKYLVRFLNLSRKFEKDRKKKLISYSRLSDK